MAEREQLVDPAVSRAKFDREVAQYRALEDDYIRRGWWLVKVAFPEVFVVFGTPRLAPPSVPFGVLLDFTNYDFLPPSVQLVNPFTRVPYRAKELMGLPFLRGRERVAPASESEAQGQAVELEVQPLLQWHGDEEIPFLCLPGVREYHEHPAHTGDDWLLHRRKGEGTLYFLLDQIYTYGVRPIAGYNLEVRVQANARIAGYVQEEPPR